MSLSEIREWQSRPLDEGQIVHVRFAEPIEIDSIWNPVWVTGKIGLERYASELAEAGYSMEGQGIEEYRYGGGPGPCLTGRPGCGGAFTLAAGHEPTRARIRYTDLRAVSPRKG